MEIKIGKEFEKILYVISDEDIKDIPLEIIESNKNGFIFEDSKLRAKIATFNDDNNWDSICFKTSAYVTYKVALRHYNLQ